MVASVVGLVEAGAFEDDACAGADESFDPSFAAGGADFDGFVAHGLELFEGVVAVRTFVFVGGHCFVLSLLVSSCWVLVGW